MVTMVRGNLVMVTTVMVTTVMDTMVQNPGATGLAVPRGRGEGGDAVDESSPVGFGGGDGLRHDPGQAGPGEPVQPAQHPGLNLAGGLGGAVAGRGGDQSGPVAVVPPIRTAINTAGRRYFKSSASAINRAAE